MAGILLHWRRAAPFCRFARRGTMGAVLLRSDCGGEVIGISVVYAFA
jgi:hypothetical protein